jgi:hypothetical protein
LFASRSSMDLARVLIHCLHLRKDVANEIASSIVLTRQRLFSTDLSLNSTCTNDEHCSMSITNDNNRTKATDWTHQQRTHADRKRNRTELKTLPMMSRITTYLSHVDTRVFNYIIDEFLHHGTYIYIYIYIYTYN